jgi:molybdenum cofactor cytidylyltransferase
LSFTSLSILIPAAGASRRLGQPKQLLQHKGNSLLGNAVNAAHSIAPREIIVVTGAHSEAVRTAVQHPSVRWVDNPKWPEGMGGSIAIGSAAISPKSTGLMILLCDQWRINAQDFEILVKTWRSAPERIVVAEAEGQYMPPVIFPSICFTRLRELKGDQGARSLFEAHQDLITPVPIANAAFDLDTPTDLDRM